MIKEIIKSEFEIIIPLLSKKKVNLEVKSIIKSINPGRIFVDSVDQPKSAMIWSDGQKGFYFIGDEKNIEFNQSLNDFIDFELKEKCIDLGLNRFEFSGETENWNPTFFEIFKHRDLNISKQMIFRIEKKDWKDYSKRLNTTYYKLYKIDKSLILNKKYRNTDFLIDEILRWWSSIEDFLEKSHGFCMIDHDTITNYSIGNFYFDQVMTIGIETLKKYRRKGLSQITCEAFIEECFKDNITIQWECMKENLPSYKLAEKMGFNKMSEYSLFSFPWMSK